jgi:hypothetical protein
LRIEKSLIFIACGASKSKGGKDNMKKQNDWWSVQGQKDRRDEVVTWLEDWWAAVEERPMASGDLFKVVKGEGGDK